MRVPVIEHYGGYLGRDPMLIREVLNRDNKSGKPVEAGHDSKEYLKDVQIAQDRFVAYSFLCCSDPKRYKNLINELSNQYSCGTCQFPDDLTTAFSMLENCKDDSKRPKKEPDARAEETDETYFF